MFGPSQRIHTGHPRSPSSMEAWVGDQPYIIDFRFRLAPLGHIPTQQRVMYYRGGVTDTLDLSTNIGADQTLSSKQSHLGVIGN